MLDDTATTGFEDGIAHYEAQANYAPSSVLTLDQFLRYEAPPRTTLLSPWLKKGSLNMIYAPTGIGKTWFAIQLAYSLASGSLAFGRWQCDQPKKVLYIDGEMAVQDFRERLALIIGRSQADIPAERMANLSILSAEVHERRTGHGLPDLSQRGGQVWYEQQIFPADVVFIDNLGCLWHGGDENKAVDWDETLTWLRSLRARGATIVLIHHAGKTGVRKDQAGEVVVQYRGSSRLAEPMDVVLALFRPQDYLMAEGASFEVHFSKARSVYGEDVQPFLVCLNVSGADGSAWSVECIQPAQDTLTTMLRAGKSVADVINATGKSRATVYRGRRRLGTERTFSEATGEGPQSLE